MFDKNGFQIRDYLVTRKRILTSYQEQADVTEVLIPEGVTEIGKQAFECCETLKRIVIPASVTEIQPAAFRWCVNLEQLVIEGRPKVSEFGYIVGGCDKLTYVSYDGIAMDISQYPSMPRAHGAFYNRLLYDLASDNVIMGLNDMLTDVVCKAFTRYPDQKKWSDYIIKYLTDVFHSLIDRNQTALLQEVLNTGAFLTRENIGDLILYANEKQRYEMQILLTEFKKKYIGYESEEDILKKFEL